MNRIYQGKVTKVQTLKPGAKGIGPDDWQDLPDWQDALWQHHQLFQDAVNYYTLALAALAEGLASEKFTHGWIQAAGERAAADPKLETDEKRIKARADAEKVAQAQIKAALSWRDKVRESWQQATRKATRFDGPHARVASWFGLNPATSDFAACAKRVLRANSATTDIRAAALLQLLEEADKSDLNQMCVSRLPWFCTPKGQLDATPKTVVAEQEKAMLAVVRVVHEASATDLETIGAQVEPGYFMTQFPKAQMTGEEARAEAERLFAACAKKFKALDEQKEAFRKRLDKFGAELSLPCLGRKPKGCYPYAVIFKLLPSAATWECFKQVTASQFKRAQKGVTAPAIADCIANTRINDEPLFEYFTNFTLVREAGNKDRAVWFDLDLAAFIEAIKSPHRYFQDTIKREQAADQLKAKIAAMKARGRAASGEEDALPGFEGDNRIALLEELVTDTLGYLAEADASTTPGGKTEYSIQERTVRGFSEVKRRWLGLVEKKPATTEDELLKVLADEQGKHGMISAAPPFTANWPSPSSSLSGALQEQKRGMRTIRFVPGWTIGNSVVNWRTRSAPSGLHQPMRCIRRGSSSYPNKAASGQNTKPAPLP